MSDLLEHVDFLCTALSILTCAIALYPLQEIVELDDNTKPLNALKKLFAAASLFAVCAVAAFVLRLLSGHTVNFYFVGLLLINLFFLYGFRRFFRDYAIEEEVNK
ncbi:MAG: hypothetical protein ACRCWJ_13940 [Casimicrobium sp.]